MLLERAQLSLMDTRANDAAAIRQTIRGNGEAFSGLVQRYYPAVFATAFAHLKCRETAEEAAQEAFLRAYVKLDSLKRPEFFPVWVHQITRNVATDWLRRGIRHSEILQMVPLDDFADDQIPDHDSLSPRDQLSRSREQQRLDEAISGLPEELREVLLLHFVDEMPNAEIARRVGLDRSSVGRRIGKALDLLRQAYGSDVEAQASAAIRPSGHSLARASALGLAVGALPEATRAAVVAAAVGTPTAAAAVSSLASGASSLLSGAALVKGGVAVAGAITGIGIAVYATSDRPAGTPPATKAVAGPAIKSPRPATDRETSHFIERSAPGAAAFKKAAAAPPSAGGSSVSRPALPPDGPSAVEPAVRHQNTYAALDAPLTAPLTAFTGDLIIESRSGGKNSVLYRDAGYWIDSQTPPDLTKSTASGLTPPGQCGSRKVLVAQVNDPTLTTQSAARFFPNFDRELPAHVYVTWPRAANVKPVLVAIRHADGIETKSLEQNSSSADGRPANSNTWIPLGRYFFAGGGDQFVQLSLGDSPRIIDPYKNSQFYADGVRFTAAPLPPEETLEGREAAEQPMIESARESARTGLLLADGRLTMPFAPDGSPWPNASRWARYYYEAADKPGSIVGVVTDAEGHPVAGADISARLQLVAGGHVWAEYAVPGVASDASGIFGLEGVALGPYSVRASKPGHASGKGAAVLLTREEPLGRAEVQLQNEVSISGTVLDEKGQPVPGIYVVVSGSGHGYMSKHAQMNATSDKLGRFTIKVDQDGKYYLRAEPKPGTGYAKQIVYDVAVGTKDLRIELKRGGTISGRVLQLRQDGTTVPLAGHPVFADTSRFSYAFLGSALSTRTDSDGRFRFENLTADIRHEFSGKDEKPRQRPWKIICQDTSRTVSFEDGGEAGDVELLVKDARPWAAGNWTISGEVLDADTSKPITQFRVKTRDAPDDGPLQSFNDYSRDATPGRFRVQWPAERGVQILIEAEGYEPALSRVIYGSKPEHVFDAVLKPAAGLLGKVLLGDQPVPGAQVVLYRLSDLIRIRNGRPDLDSGVFSTTDKDGWFTLPSQPDQTYILMAFSDIGFAEITGTDLARNPAVQLGLWAKLEGELITEDKPRAGALVKLQGEPLMRSSSPTTNQVHWYMNAETDADGRFTIDRVPPFLRNGNVGPEKRRGNMLGVHFTRPVEFTPGETTRIELEGSMGGGAEKTVPTEN